MAGENPDSGMKNAAMATPIIRIYLMPQKPFCIGARPSLDVFTPIIRRENRTKKQNRAKQILYTAKYPTAWEQSIVGTTYDAVEVEFTQNGTCFKASCNPGARVMAATIVVANSIIAYIKRVDVLFRHEGHAEQHSEQAVPVQQQAS
jgi:hypothetical protein